MRSHTDLQHKLRLRNEAFTRFCYPLKTVVDFFAGEGEIARHFWSPSCTRLICVERDPARSRGLVDIPNAEVICGDNCDFVHLATEADVVDCDAYGSVAGLLGVVAEQGRRPQLIFFTDGSLGQKGLPGFRRALEDLSSDYLVEKSLTHHMYYGWLYLEDG